MVEPTTWTCPTCGRRVPSRAPECHCGMLKGTAVAMAVASQAEPPMERLRIPTPRVRLAMLPKEVRFLVIGGIVVTLLGLGWLFVPRKPERALPLLGSLDSIPVPPPTPTPRPRAKPTPTPLAPGATILGTPLPAPPAALRP